MPPFSWTRRIAGRADYRKPATARRYRLSTVTKAAHMVARPDSRRNGMVEQQRMDITKLAPEAYRHLLALEQTVAAKLDRKLFHLLKLRASQINGCAFCIGMHSDEAMRDGETAERLLLLDAWQESSAFSEKERAALQWIEELTLIADSHASQEAFDGLKKFFSEEEIAYLTLTGVAINAWNRIAIASRGQYDRAMFHKLAETAKVAEPA
jgi:AhpD family alkylhydroperoxidase